MKKENIQVGKTYCLFKLETLVKKGYLRTDVKDYSYSVLILEKDSKGIEYTLTYQARGEEFIKMLKKGAKVKALGFNKFNKIKFVHVKSKALDYEFFVPLFFFCKEIKPELFNVK